MDHTEQPHTEDDVQDTWIRVDSKKRSALLIEAIKGELRGDVALQLCLEFPKIIEGYETFMRGAESPDWFRSFCFDTYMLKAEDDAEMLLRFDDALLKATLNVLAELPDIATEARFATAVEAYQKEVHKRQEVSWEEWAQSALSRAGEDLSHSIASDVKFYKQIFPSVAKKLGLSADDMAKYPTKAREAVPSLRRAIQADDLGRVKEIYDRVVDPKITKQQNREWFRDAGTRVVRGQQLIAFRYQATATTGYLLIPYSSEAEVARYSVRLGAKISAYDGQEAPAVYSQWVGTAYAQALNFERDTVKVNRDFDGKVDNILLSTKLDGEKEEQALLLKSLEGLQETMTAMGYVAIVKVDYISLVAWTEVTWKKE